MSDGLDGVYDGIVVDNADPLGLGRVRFTIPGLIEPSSGWASPIGFGGKAQRGKWDVPDKGATVSCQFLMGDVDRPMYQHGYPGRGERPRYLSEVGKAEVHLVKVYETAEFEVAIDDRPAKKLMVLRAKESGTEVRIGDDGVATITATRINLGDATAAQPFVLGTLWKNMMGQLFQYLIAHTHVTNVGMSAPSAQLASQLPTIQLDTLLSKIAFAKE